MDPHKFRRVVVRRRRTRRRFKNELITCAKALEKMKDLALRSRLSGGGFKPPQVAFIKSDGHEH